MSADHETKERTETTKKPAKLWRNLYWCDLPVQGERRILGPGHWWGSMTWPSYDVADSVGQEFVRKNPVMVVAAGLRFEGPQEEK